ncbi:MAG: hypothetical protein GX913_08680 [Clostridiales bacterium]|nr:hypothetical protein [Clostridiales bacterium]
MRWYKNLFIGTNAEKTKHEIVEKVKSNKPQLNVFVLTLPSNEKNLLDIFHSTMLLQPYYISKDFFVVGLAKGYEEALEVMTQIVIDTYNETGGFHVKEYLESKIS